MAYGYSKVGPFETFLARLESLSDSILLKRSPKAPLRALHSPEHSTPESVHALRPARYLTRGLGNG